MHRIIEPITSRCSKFRFKPLDTSSTAARLREICVAEKVDCPDEVRCLALQFPFHAHIRLQISY